MTTYAVSVLFTVDERSDEHLHTPDAIKAEVQSWLEGLGAVVSHISVGPLPSSDVDVRPEDK